MTPLLYPAAGVLFLWMLFGLYVLVMGLYRAKLADRLSPLAKVLGLPYLVVGYLMDVIGNWTVATLVFLELPKEVLITNRLKRHIKVGVGWRCAVAQWTCQHLLDPYDPTGTHCD